MKHSKYTYIAVLAGALVGTLQTAQATCFCACVEGADKTLCDDLAEANTGLNLCLNGLMARPESTFTAAVKSQCPEPIGSIDPTVSEPIPSGAENCVRLRIYDPATALYSMEKNVCDVTDVAG